MDPNKLFRQKALEKLQSPDRLDELMTVTAPSMWIVLAVAGLLCGALLLWAALGTVQLRAGGEGVLVDEPGGELAALVYVSLADGARIQPGMAVGVAPVSVPRERFGLLRGTVSAVERLPSTSAAMLAQVRNDALVQGWVARGNLIAVRVRLTRDPATPSGYSWSLGQGSAAPLQSGLAVSANIIVSQQRPIALLLP